MIILDWMTGGLLLAGLFFFTAGTIGLIRLPDLHCRLHALTKADNVGLGFVMVAFMLQVEHWTSLFKLGLIWLLILAAGATVSFLIARQGGGMERRKEGRDGNVV